MRWEWVIQQENGGFGQVPIGAGVQTDVSAMPGLPEMWNAAAAQGVSDGPVGPMFWLGQR